ncbi:hypothetical protein [Methylocystis sp. S23]|jgi:hypothetical protein
MASPLDAASAWTRAARNATVALASAAYLCASCPRSDDTRAGDSDTRVGDSTDGPAVSEYVEKDDGAHLYLEARGDHANAPL